MKDILEKLINRVDLQADEAENMMNSIMEGKLTDAQIAGLLIALRMKGETASEIGACAKVMRAKASGVDTKGMECIDTCGTGGDGADTFNVSTAAAFVLAAAGLKVAKHGNRSVSSKSGSADVLEALGCVIELSPDMVSELIRDVNMGFMFAPVYHSAMKYAIGPRRQLKVRTIFNLLGPLSNPADAAYQLLGVYDGKLTETMAEALKKLGTKRAMVVHSNDGLDEISVCDVTKVSELKQDGEIVNYIIDPKDYGFTLADSEDIKGGDAYINANIIKAVFNGEIGAPRDMVVINSSAAFYISGMTGSIDEGIKLAEKTIDEGRAADKLYEYIEATGRVNVSF